MKREDIFNHNSNKSSSSMSNSELNKYEKLHNTDSKVNNDIDSQQSEFAKHDVGGRLDRNRERQHQQYMNKHSHNTEQDSNFYQENAGHPVYIDYLNRKNYPNKDFYGDVTKPWSVDNTAGWSENDMSNPYNPNRRDAKDSNHKKMSFSKKFLIGIIIVIVLLLAWFAGTDYEASHQSAKPQHPQVIRKTIINHEPQSSSNVPSSSNTSVPSNPKNNQVLTPNDEQQINKLTGELQRLQLTNQEQQELLNAYGKLSNNMKPRVYKIASWAGNTPLIPNNVKRFMVIHVMNHYANQ